MSRHSWQRIVGARASAIDRWICQHCGMVRTGRGSPYSYHLKPAAYYMAPKHITGRTPPCDDQWPRWWRPMGAETVRPDLFPVQQADAADPSPGDAPAAAASAAFQEH